MDDSDIPDDLVKQGGSDVKAKVAEADARAQNDVINTIGGEAPIAESGLNPSRVDEVAAMLGETIRALTGGEFADPPVAATASYPRNQLPAPVYAGLEAVAGFIEHAKGQGVKGIDRYAFDPVEVASSDDGLAQVTGILDALRRDQRVIDALEQPVKPGKAKAPASKEKPAPQGGEEDPFDDVV